MGAILKAMTNPPGFAHLPTALLVAALLDTRLQEKGRRYTYVWGNNEKRATLKGRKCRVILRSKMNSALVEFVDNGQREVVSRSALRRCRK